MITIKGDLILTEDLVTFDESIKVEGNIISKDYKRNLKAGNINACNIDAGNINACDIDAGNINACDIDAGNISAWDIDARNIDARNINACDIDAGNINACDIDAGNISAWDIICESRKKKFKTSKTICRVFVTDKSKLERKERGKSLVEEK